MGADIEGVTSGDQKTAIQIALYRSTEPYMDVDERIKQHAIAQLLFKHGAKTNKEIEPLPSYEVMKAQEDWYANQ